jgi:soluble lytic murein transglycosylase-like protein
LDLPRPVAVPSVPQKLLAFFEVSTNYKSVRHHVRNAAKRYNLDYELLKALISTESGFDPQAVSPKGAMGLMQLMPATAQRYGIKGDAKTPLEKRAMEPQANIEAGSRYLRDLMNMFPGRMDLALAAYNAGEGAVLRAGKQIPNFKETQNYVQTVTQLYGALKPPPPPPPKAMEPTAPVQPARVRMTIGGTGQAGGAVGGAVGRGNMVPSLVVPPVSSAASEPLAAPVLRPN